MDDMFEFGMEEFVKYERDLNLKPTKHQKKQIKIEKLKHDLHDPEQRKKRHDERRKLEKVKLQKELEGMNEEEARIHLDQKR